MDPVDSPSEDSFSVPAQIYQRPYDPFQKPEKVSQIGMITVVSGVVNIFAGLMTTCFALIGAVATLGLGLIAVPCGLLPLGLGAYEIFIGTGLLSNPPRSVHQVKLAAILEIIAVMTLNFFSLIIGITSLVFQNEPEVKAYFSRFGQIV